MEFSTLYEVYAKAIWFCWTRNRSAISTTSPLNHVSVLDLIFLFLEIIHCWENVNFFLSKLVKNWFAENIFEEISDGTLTEMSIENSHYFNSTSINHDKTHNSIIDYLSRIIWHEHVIRNFIISYLSCTIWHEYVKITRESCQVGHILLLEIFETSPNYYEKRIFGNRLSRDFFC